MALILDQVRTIFSRPKYLVHSWGLCQELISPVCHVLVRELAT